MFFKHNFIVLLHRIIYNLPLAKHTTNLYAKYMKFLALTLPNGPNGGTEQITAPAGIPSGGIALVAKIVGNAITILIIVTVLLTLLYLILGGIQWIQSGGDKQKVTQARARLTYAVIGLIVALFSFFIVNIIGYVFKVNLLTIGG
jgi:hypothetical protein